MFRIFCLVVIDLFKWVFGSDQKFATKEEKLPVLVKDNHNNQFNDSFHLQTFSATNIVKVQDEELIRIPATKETLISTPPFQLQLPASLINKELNSPEYKKLLLPMIEDLEKLQDLGVAYVSLSQVPLHIFPHQDFDSIIKILPYGQPVMIKGYNGRFAMVVAESVVGYIEKDYLENNRRSVWPDFVIGEIYHAEHETTIKLRLLLSDMYSGGRCYLNLQAGEYVTLRLLRDQIKIPWTEARPRLPGQWHQLLRGVIGVRSQVSPLSDSIIEWTAEDGTGRLAYVEQVLPDQTIVITGVGLVVAGEYSQVTLTSSIWREWRPVFITFT